MTCIFSVRLKATKFSEYEAIYFPYNLDWRGRVYAIPSFNPQGNDLTKGLLMASIAEPVGKDGIEWLKIHGANCAGVDKVDFGQRKKWVEDNEELILEIARDPLGQPEWIALSAAWRSALNGPVWLNTVSCGSRRYLSRSMDLARVFSTSPRCSKTSGAGVQ